MAGNRYWWAQGVNDLVITTGGDFQYVEGAIIRFGATNTNTGAVTLNVDGKGVKPLKYLTHAELPPGRLKQYQYYEAIYDSFHDYFYIKTNVELDAHLADNTRHRRIILSDQDANPDLMQNGDIWIKYTDEE